MRILMVAAEAAPYVKVGGLGDVVGALPGALAAQGADVELLIPGYRAIDRAAHGFAPAGSIDTWFAERVAPVPLSRVKRKDGVTVSLVEDAAAFGRSGVYDDADSREGYTDNPGRFAFFSRVAADKVLRDRPDLVHLHDCHAALVAPLLRTVLAPYQSKPIPTVLTIHNLAYQMTSDPRVIFEIGIDRGWMRPMSPFEWYGNTNFLKAGITFADALTTVSPRYALEITHPSGGAGLDGVLRERSDRLFGILNGIDVDAWDPATDRALAKNYSRSDRTGKGACRAALLAEAHLSAGPRVPVFAMVSRLVDQKGVDILVHALPRLFQSADCRVVVLGSGQERWQAELTQLERRFRDRMSVKLGFDEGLAHRIEAGADFFLMPSRFEPCGLNQMYSMRYGTLPIVRRVGGLADTVIDLFESPDRGTGFVFDAAEPDALLARMRIAAELFAHGDARIARAIDRAMAQDFSWRRSAQLYLELFRKVVE